MAYAQMRGLATVRTGDLTGPLELTDTQERELLSRMNRSGLIARVRRGLYLIPAKLPLGGTWTPGMAQALNTLLADRGGRYQICGPNTFNRYGFDEQVPNRIYAYNNRISGDRTIGAVALSLIKVADDRLGATTEWTDREGQVAVYSSRVRTLLDAVHDWSRFNSLPRGYDWIRGELESGRVCAEEFVEVTRRFGNLTSIRRIGVLLEQRGVSDRLLGKLERALRPSTRTIPWIPNQPAGGTVNRRWNVIVQGEG